MSTRTSSGPARTTLAFALITAAALGLTACAGGDPATAPAGASGAPGAVKGALPTEDVVAGVKKNEAAAKLLPADVRQRGGFTIASSVATPPSSAYLPDGRTVVGVDADFAGAVAKALGLELKREAVGFEAILPALGSGKYDVGSGNFGVTEERRRTIDFVTYINDGQGFATRADSPLKEITDLTRLCGLKVAVDAGTTFERTLEKNKGRCAEAGRKPYEINVYNEVGAVWFPPAGAQRHRDEHDQRPAVRGDAAEEHEVPQRVPAPRRRLRLQEGHAARAGLPGRGERSEGRRDVRPDPEEVGGDGLGHRALADLPAGAPGTGEVAVRGGGGEVPTGRQQSQPQLQSPQQQPSPSQQEEQLLQQSQQSQQLPGSHWPQRPSRRCRLQGSSYVPQHIWQVQARPTQRAQPAISPRRPGGPGGNGPPGPPGPPGPGA